MAYFYLQHGRPLGVLCNDILLYNKPDSGLLIEPNNIKNFG